MGKMTNAGERMLAAREEMIDRILKSVEAHDLTDGQMVAVCVMLRRHPVLRVRGLQRGQPEGDV